VADARETAGLTTSLLLAYVRRHGGGAAVTDVLRIAGVEDRADSLADEHSWTSYSCKVALLEAAASVLGQPDIGRRLGEHVLDERVGASLQFALRVLGSPSMLLRSMPRTASRFSTAATTEAIEVHRTGGVVRYRVLEGHRPARVDCDYTLGLLTRIPVLFGLPPADIRHRECQVQGAEACIYEISWSRYRRLLGRRRALFENAEEVLLEQLRVLQESVTDLVTEEDVDALLDRVAVRARSTVHAPAHLLVARWPETPDWIVRRDGLSEAETTALMPLIVGSSPDETRQVPLDGSVLLITPLRSVRRHYGWLAAALPGRQSTALPAEVVTFESYAALAASAMEAHLTYTEAVRREQMSETLLALARRLLACESAAAVLDAVLTAALRISGADNATAFSWDGPASCMRVSGHRGWSPELAPALDEVVISLEDTPELAAQLREPDRCMVLRTAELSEDPFLLGLQTTFDVNTTVSVPLHTDGSLSGVMLVNWLGADGRDIPISPLMVQTLTGLADQATTALAKACLHQQMREQADTDQLTGLANRRVFLTALDEELAATDTGALVFLDLDNFKEVNDSLGHAAGDALLVDIADRLRQVTREGDLVARLGGDEFTILLRGVTDPEELERIISRISACLRKPLVFDQHAVPARASVGGIWLDGDEAESVLLRADAAMYRAKRSGGDTAVISPEREIS
jgi:diguanylate cyclase (GGDEF)-like protein